MTIFNNGLQFKIGEEEIFRAMISADKNVSRYYKLPGRETVRGPFLDIIFGNHIKNQHEKLLIGSDIIASVRGKCPGFCKCLRFSKSGFATFYNSAGHQK